MRTKTNGIIFPTSRDEFTWLMSFQNECKKNNIICDAAYVCKSLYDSKLTPKDAAIQFKLKNN